MEDLADLAVVVRRVVGARVRDVHLVEDLTQETLVHVAAADPRLDPDARAAYAIVTARNVVVSHARSSAMHDRHAHRLVDYTSLTGPEELTLQREESDALTTALQQLDADDRDLLLRHEAHGDSIELLAAEHATTGGAVAMRLARARATLRLEFLLAFRRLELPTQRCRPVLLALSAGDRRRQQTLGAAAHLLRCSTCAQLAEPVTERRRGLAGWFLVPAGEALRRAARSLRHNHLTQVTAAALTAVAVATILIMTRPANNPPVAAPRPVAAAQAPIPTTAATTTTPSTTTPPPAPATAPPNLTCPPPAPLDQLDPTTTPPGCPIAATTLAVTDVPADEAFWATTANGANVWVQLVGHGESPINIVAGAHVAISGTTADPASIGSIATDPRIATGGWVLHVDYTNITPG
jgi:RNA polymerase sigma factor (sigma-70 family)